ncbi:MAG: hypothetical protein EZS28_002980 [Streblomastix strix]|uniref:Tyr recombinase domain-containing protein n=1 Tax=Streblomastix strix TaxID=222440 RepID=A0A5J4X2C3_9EUKA|nr:MAG: hypothetical protein EZS28_002980 [Streblomastix strix]
MGAPGTSINSLSIGERPESNLLSDEELQAKLDPLLMSLCFVRMKEIANIDLSVSIIDNEKHTAALLIQPKQSKKRDMMQEEQKILKNVQQRTFLLGLVQTLGVQNATANSIRHASSTELAAQGFDERTINVFTHHTLDSKMNKKFYVFAVNKEQDSITSALVKNDGEKQATQINSKQRGDEGVSDGDRLQQSPFTFSIPIISTQPIVEAESLNDRESAKLQNSQMQKDNQDIEPQNEAQNSSMTKDSDRATTAGAQK